LLLLLLPLLYVSYDPGGGKCWLVAGAAHCTLHSGVILLQIFAKHTTLEGITQRRSNDCNELAAMIVVFFLGVLKADPREQIGHELVDVVLTETPYTGIIIY
jgi:hypothetical protein